MGNLQKWIVSLALITIAVSVSFEWLDRPIAFYVHDHVSKYEIFSRLTQLPEIMTPLAGLLLFWLGLRALAGRPLSYLQAVILLCGLSLVVADAVKSQLKFAFGRTWPETWVRDNPSLIRDGVYGFNPFHGGPGYASFPSGHTAAICAVMSVLWICYPRFRPIYALCVLAVAVGLVGADYHFLGDIIAGGFIGVSTGWIAVAMWKAGFSQVFRPALHARGTPAASDAASE